MTNQNISLFEETNFINVFMYCSQLLNNVTYKITYEELKNLIVGRNNEIQLNWSSSSLPALVPCTDWHSGLYLESYCSVLIMQLHSNPSE